MRRRRAAENSSSDVVLHDVVRRVAGGRVVLDGVSATFEAGTVTAVIGANGAGKSTLARVVAGTDRVDAGAVIRPRSAYFLPERIPALAGCSARTVAAALGPSVGRDRAFSPSRLASALQSLAFTHEADAPLRVLSKGNAQKAYLAVAYALRPAVAVLDEPTTGLDPAAADAAARLLRDLAADGSVVLVTAHGPVAGAHLQHRLAAGRLTPDEGRPASRCVVELEAHDARSAAAWRDGRAGLRYEVVPLLGAQDVLRLLVDRAYLPVVLRAALDDGDAVVRVEPAEPW